MAQRLSRLGFASPGLATARIACLASLPLFGAGVVESYRAMERDALARRLAELEQVLAPPPTADA